jgi:hypothetical protein
MQTLGDMPTRGHFKTSVATGLKARGLLGVKIIPFRRQTGEVNAKL